MLVSDLADLHVRLQQNQTQAGKEKPGQALTPCALWYQVVALLQMPYLGTIAESRTGRELSQELLFACYLLDTKFVRLIANR